jgi:hypothetical protein
MEETGVWGLMCGENSDLANKGAAADALINGFIPSLFNFS